MRRRYRKKPKKYTENCHLQDVMHTQRQMIRMMHGFKLQDLLNKYRRKRGWKLPGYL